jgi:hypothetical protein
MACRARSRIDSGAAVSGTAAARVARLALLFARRPRVFLSRRSTILVLGHMRSYSSVLCHILGSHPEIAGYAEMHLSYRTPLDLLRLRARVSRSLGCVMPGRFVLDKVLHDEYVVAPSILRREDVNAIVVVRRPAESIRSVLAMGERIPSVGWYSDVDAVVEYYVRRLRSLAEVRQQASHCLFVRAEDIVQQTSRVLTEVERFLGLRQELTDEYEIFPNTGVPGFGDDSPEILAGRIVRPPERAGGDVLPQAALAAVRAYEECCAAHTRIASP